jgi:hypothetical protein
MHVKYDQNRKWSLAREILTIQTVQILTDKSVSLPLQSLPRFHLAGYLGIFNLCIGWPFSKFEGKDSEAMLVQRFEIKAQDDCASGVQKSE